MSGATHGDLPELKGQQRAASDPRQHVWLSASAGTGKTQVLAARVFRLLLRGTRPEAILALTFTKAGAAEMAARINARLARWVRAEPDAIGKDLIALGETPTPDLIAHARTLFASVLDAAGGGLRIQTIHSFCQALLAAFPVEAGLAPGFRPLDTREEAVLQRTTLSELLVNERQQGRERSIAAIGALSLRLGEGGAEGFLIDCARRPADMAALPMGEGAKAWLKRELDVPERDVMEHLAECCGDDAFDLVGLRRIASANRAWGAATGIGHADMAERWLAAPPAERVELLGDLAGIALTKSGEARKYSPKLIDAEPDYEQLARSLGGCCSELLALVARARFAEVYGEALMAGRDYAAAYTHAKRRAGAVDFDDLIRSAVSLLQTPGIGDWVRYKLDQDTEHVLIDEAQDTNLRQWEIVDALAGEFFAGVGTRATRFRTLFTVGDYKQAIFGFQGTDPFNFQWAEGRFKRLADDNLGEPGDPPDLRGLPMAQLSLTHSFRSTRPILEFVDAALAAIPEPGLGAPLEAHASEVKGPGAVELWPPVVAGGDPDDEESWVDDATREVAKQIARQIRAWLDSGFELGSKGRPLRPEDVMILVKRRGDLASLLVARLHAESVPVAGIDRLRLNAPLAVQDLLAAIRFVLQPDDSLALASLLVSPLLGWTQDELLAAATPRDPGVSLWSHIRDREDARLVPLYEMLARADLVSPYRFLEELLSGPLEGRRRLLARLGEEARDPIEELLSAALAFEESGTPSLQPFLDWFDRGDVEIVRDPSQPLDAVRVMTAHGAKGLQAPVVILADACLDPANSPRATLRWLPEGPGGPELPMLRPRKEERSGPLADLVAQTEARELQEHWRLFYVAATRAEERLVVTGALGSRSRGAPPTNSWYAAAAGAIDALGVVEGETLVFTGRTPQAPVRPTGKTLAVAPSPLPLPIWANAPAPTDPRPPRPLAPSALGDDQVADPPPSAAMRTAAERGRLLHALFERLPAVAPDRRRDAAERWLAGSVTDADAATEIATAACRVIGDPRFAALFGPNALAEAPIAAVVPGGAVVAGTVDRLLVTADRVLVVDYKTGRSAPGSLTAIPSYHVRQMAAYVAALRVIFPDRPVTAALLYTATPTLFELPDTLVAANLPT